jgi:hypothetical protein
MADALDRIPKPKVEPETSNDTVQEDARAMEQVRPDAEGEAPAPPREKR